MTVTSHRIENAGAASVDHRRQVLELARNLDRMACRAEEFLHDQLQQLETAREDLAREQAAWRRQQQRETAQIRKQRDEIVRLRRTLRTASPPGNLPLSDDPQLGPETAGETFSDSEAGAGNLSQTPDQAATQSGPGPIRILLEPGSATARQIGLLLLEISRLSRETGGAGVRFEIAETRLPRQKWFSRGAPGVILEIDGFCCLPLTSCNEYGAFDVDTTEHLDSWTIFKTRLLRSSLRNAELELSFREAQVAPRHLESRTLVLEANAYAVEAVEKSSEHRYSRPAFRVSQGLDAVRRQLARLENCADCLVDECGLKINVSLR